MPFKIVQTIEDGNFCLCVVPSGWEVNGKLFWPNRANATKLLKDEKSIPAETWIQMNCIKKREFQKRADAEKEAEQMELGGDTEQEEVPVTEQEVVPVDMELLKEQNGNRSTMDPKDFNMFIEEDLNLQDGMDSSAVLIETSQVLPKVVYVDRGNASMSQNDQAVGEPEPTLRDVIYNQHCIIKGQAKLQASLDFVTEWICNGNATHTSKGFITTNNAMISPVGSLEELETLDASLKVPKEMDRYVNGMKTLYGTSGKSNGLDVAYHLIDHFATRLFLTTCSWSGASRPSKDSGEAATEGTNEKVGLKFYPSFRELFFQLVHLADKDFSKNDCKEFFMRVTKNSKQRLNSGPTNHKNRPRNLNYKKKNPDEDDARNTDDKNKQNISDGVVNGEN